MKIATLSLLTFVVVGVAIGVAVQQGILFPKLAQNAPGPVSGPYSTRVLELEVLVDKTTDKSGLLRIEQGVTKILQSPGSPAEEAQAKLLLAKMFIYKYANSQSIVQGIELTKEVAKDTTYPDLWRAVAFERASHLVRDVADDEYLAILWNDELFATFQHDDFPEVGAIKNICEASFALHPLPLCSYRIAGYELARLIEDKVRPQLSTQEQAEYLADAKEKIAAGNRVFADYPLPYINLFDKGKILLLRANRQAELYLLGQELPVGFKESAEADLKQSYDIFNSGKALPDSQEGFITYYYAVFLAQVYGQERLSDTNALTDRLVDLHAQNRNKPFFLYMKKIAAKLISARNATWKIGIDTALLAQINPRFKDFLIKELGWSEEVLNTRIPSDTFQ